jgi:hypothetical protein
LQAIIASARNVVQSDRRIVGYYLVCSLAKNWEYQSDQLFQKYGEYWL